MIFLKQFWKFFVIGTATILLMGIVYIVYENRSFKKEISAVLHQSVDVTIAAVDQTAFERLSAQIEDLQSPDYVRLREQFVRLKDVYDKDGIRGFYAMKMDGDEIRFFVDSAPVEDVWHSDPGVVYREPPTELLNIFNGAPEQMIGPYTDEFGSFYSFMGPVKNSLGDVIAVIGVDISKDSFNNILKNYLRLPIMIVLLVLLSYLFVLSLVLIHFRVLLSAKEKQNLVKEVEKVTEELNSKVAELKKEAGELANFKKLTINREMRMIELKKEIEFLKTTKNIQS